ncbi:flagellar biosynthesis protein FlhF [Franzmannia pantelleriensis]|uniref:Flagellar biosynthesis protein FlhF n=1 Tax=Franzmannia pantelleriensis TaxID=48727 RepID=A0A1G9ENS7_9GAMM|nr:flagellar biosynthesis protein FlhF [Halomonas pantelleriensis]SDK77769.1 flagellar biosynthesis protein FlhF [Halomonas pantelleriensis]
MSVQRFLGANSREAMRQVRAALGDDALILSNRNVEGGVEILALADDAHGRMTTTEQTRSAPAETPSGESATGLRSAADASRQARAYASQAVARTPPPRQPEPPARPAEQPAAPAQPDFAALSERLLGEMQEMRDMLGRQQRERHGDHDPLARLHQRLWSAGVGPRLSAELLAELPAELDAATDSDAQDAWLARQLAARLSVPRDEAALFDEGGVIALVGPTGVGKTTTTAKLAARYVMRHGSDGVALVTTDSYRIGAHEQLRIYARLLGVDVYAQDAEAALDETLARLADKRLVIIDTVGMSQRDQRLVRQIEQLSASGRRVRLLLLLNAASHGDTLEDVILSYRQAARAANNRLDDCILTKRDESARLGPLLDSVIRHGLRLHYVSHGQQVPEDLSLADATSLVSEALRVEDDSPFTPEFSALREPVPSGQKRLTALSRGLLGQGRALRAALDTLRANQPGFALVEGAWQLAGQPLARQRAALDGMHGAQLAAARETGDRGGLTLLWGGQRVNGCDWRLPCGAVSGEGRLLASGWQVQRLPSGDVERLEWSAQQLGPEAHVLAAMPSSPALAWLSAWQLPWLAAAKPNQRVELDGQRLPLAELATLATHDSDIGCRYQGRRLTLALHRLSVRHAAARGNNDAPPLSLLTAVPVDLDSGRRLTRRYWLAPEAGDDESRRLIARQLLLAELPALTRRAWQGLADAGFDGGDAELRLQLAHGLANVALSLAHDDDEWAMDVRAQLLALLGSQRSRQASTLLDALIHLFTARDVFREVAA